MINNDANGTFLLIFGIGVLITGRSKEGKSSIALELISRGHKFIADDIYISDLKQKYVFGKKTSIHDFLYINDYDFINIKKIFGGKAVHRKPQKVDFIINIGIPMKNIEHHDTLLLDLKKLKINPSVFIEIAIKNYKLKKNGYNANQEFIKEQLRITNQKENDSHNINN